jgi:hypothetical protein
MEKQILNQIDVALQRVKQEQYVDPENTAYKSMDTITEFHVIPD